MCVSFYLVLGNFTCYVNALLLIITSEYPKALKWILPEKYPYLEFFWSVFSRIRPEYGEILCISPYLVQMRENTDQKKPQTLYRKNKDTFHAVIPSFLRICLHLLKKPLIKNFISCAVSFHKFSLNHFFVYSRSCRWVLARTKSTRSKYLHWCYLWQRRQL